jgi:predicted AAA+ superfamily ATPase
MTFISGPRQAGKTTLAKGFLGARVEKGAVGAYWNWDASEFRRQWARNPEQILANLTTDAQRPALAIFDEIHKARLWKRSLKGIYDTLLAPIDIIVTGSARLDIYQRGSDSLHGRYIPFRLHPFSVRELLGMPPSTYGSFRNIVERGDFAAKASEQDALTQILHFGGFPEPLFAQSDAELNIWRRTRLDKIVREDLRDLSRLPELSQVEMLMALLPERAGQPLSRAALREDLEVAHTTVSRWLRYLEVLYYHFEIRPFAHKIQASLKKEGKLYLWDFTEVDDAGSRFENLVANHLLKACHFWTDTGEGNFELRYLRNKSREEIDFLILKDRKPWLPIEVKLTDTNLSPHWFSFLPQLSCAQGLQLVLTPRINTTHSVGSSIVRVISAADVLAKLV